MRWRFSLQASADLRRIGHRIARDNPRAAAAWIDKRSESWGRGPAGSAGGEGVRPLSIDKLRKRAQLAGKSPGLGRKVPETNREDIREAIVGNYRLVYLVEGRTVVI